MGSAFFFAVRAVALSGRQHSASIIRVPDEKFELFGYKISFSMLPDLYAGFTKAVPVTLGNLIHSKQEEIAAARAAYSIKMTSTTGAAWETDHGWMR